MLTQVHFGTFSLKRYWHLKAVIRYPMLLTFRANQRQPLLQLMSTANAIHSVHHMYIQ